VSDDANQHAPPSDVGKQARNEKRKLTAAYLNNLAVGIAIAGLIAPYIASITPHITFQGTPSYPKVAIVVAFCISILLHFIARSILSELED
jgi:hypothetical protein